MEIWHFSKKQVQKVSAPEELPLNGFIWIDCGINEILENIVKIQEITQQVIHERHIEDCLNLNHPSFYDSVKAYDILIFRSLVSTNTNNDIETKPITFLIFNRCLVSFSNHDHAIHRIKHRFENTHKKIPPDPMTLLFFILDEVVDNFLELRNPLLETYSDWQRKLFINTKHQFNWLDFLKFKTEIRKLRTVSEDQQEVIYQWRQDNEIDLNEYATILFSDLIDHLHRIIRYATQLENDIETLIQIHYSLIGNRTNDVMRVLTVLSAIFLPLNLVAGIFGMNFSDMKLLHIPHGGELTLIGMSFLGMVLFFIFKWKEWI